MAQHEASRQGSLVAFRTPSRGDILSVNLNPTEGGEIQGARPALVISPVEFNRLGLALVCPITQGGSYTRDHGFAVSLTGAGTRIQGVILVNQMRMLSYRERQARFIERVPAFIVNEVIARIQTLLE